MNIVFTYPTLFHPERGGVERVTDILAHEFIRRGHKVYYLNNKPNAELMDYDYPAQLVWFPDTDYNTESNHRFYKKFLKDEKIDFVINQTAQFGDSSLYCDVSGTGAKVLSVVHNDTMLNYNTYFKFLTKLKQHSIAEYLRVFVKIILYPYLKFKYWNLLKHQYEWLLGKRHTDYLVLLSERFKPSIKMFVPKISLDNVVAIGNPIPFEVCRTNQKEKIVLFVGRFYYNPKRPDRIIKIWKKITFFFPDWKLVMVGDGPELPKLKQMAAGIGSIEFTGLCNPLPYYKKASILCLTSNNEGFGMVLVEAMSQGCVPISFESFVAISDLIDNQAQLVTPFSLTEYRLKLGRLMSDEKLLEKLRDVGYRTAEEFMPDVIGNKWLELMDCKHGKRRM